MYQHRDALIDSDGLIDCGWSVGELVGELLYVTALQNNGFAINDVIPLDVIMYTMTSWQNSVNYMLL